MMLDKNYNYGYDRLDISIYDVLSALSFTWKKHVENNNAWGIIDCLKKQDILLSNGVASSLIDKSDSGAIFLSPNVLFGIF